MDKQCLRFSLSGVTNEELAVLWRNLGPNARGFVSKNALLRVLGAKQPAISTHASGELHLLDLIDSAALPPLWFAGAYFRGARTPLDCVADDQRKLANVVFDSGQTVTFARMFVSCEHYRCF